MQWHRSSANLALMTKHQVEGREEPRAWEILQQQSLEVLQEEQHDRWQLKCNSRKDESRLTPRCGDAVEVSHNLPSLPQNKKVSKRPVKSRYWRKQIEIKSGKDRCESNWNTSSWNRKRNSRNRLLILSSDRYIWTIYSRFSSSSFTQVLQYSLKD